MEDFGRFQDFRFPKSWIKDIDRFQDFSFPKSWIEDFGRSKDLSFQNPESKILADFKILPL